MSTKIHIPRPPDQQHRIQFSNYITYENPWVHSRCQVCGIAKDMKVSLLTLMFTSATFLRCQHKANHKKQKEDFIKNQERENERVRN